MPHGIRQQKLVFVLSALMAFAMLDAVTGEEGAVSESTAVQFFLDKIEPVLKASCYDCHSSVAAEIQGGLRLDSAPGILKGGDRGPSVIPGNPDASILFQAIRHDHDLRMPPDKARLPDRIIKDFENWIGSGAQNPRSVEPEMVSKPDPRLHWAFQPVVSPPLPPVRGSEWLQNPVDAFVLSRLEQAGWTPAPAAARGAWIRRVTLDLTGLPPEPAEVLAFLNDGSEQAFERVVDRLLNSPHFGEHQAQHWLDVIRYAETEGYEYDTHLPGAWRFRDYVIQSMNQDKPFSQFLTEQIAGDELDPNNLEYQTATIFHRLGPVRRNAGNPELALSHNEVLTERTDVIGTAILGLSVGCARCHNHKLEPIEQKDYYRLQAYFAATDENNLSLADTGARAVWDQATMGIRARQRQLREQAAHAAEPNKNMLEQEALQPEKSLPSELSAIPATYNNFERRTPIHILRRGVWEQKGDQVSPRPPGVLVSPDVPELSADVPNPRTQLAKWLTSPENPLTARVIINRIWQQHFGIGLVQTANDFGTRGDPPSHPELLDWLASRLTSEQWQLKNIHRVIVLSNTYRQGNDSVHLREALEKDPDNRLLWHYPRRRMTAEQIRDSMLMVSGRLNRRSGGPGIMTPVDPELVQLLYKPSQWQVATEKSEQDRRSIYLIAKRNLRLPFMEVFDAPARLTSCAHRESSTHAPQALELLNGKFANDLAGSLADRIQREAGGYPEEIAEHGFRLVVGRPPTRQERELSVRFLSELPASEFALALFNLNDFLYVP